MSPRAAVDATKTMLAASTPTQRPSDARLLVIDAHGAITTRARRDWTELLREGDLVIANDAATMPASLRATHVPSGRPIEIRLAARRSLDPEDLVFDAVIFGEGDHHTRTEDRKEPPRLEPGDRLAIDGTTLVAGVLARRGHRRFVRLSFGLEPRAFWSTLARVGRPVQYAHVPEPLKLWDVWTVLAGPPVAFEPPSAGFVLDWACLDRIRSRGARFATLTHAAGLSSTGDPKLDARLPLDEPYTIPTHTAHAILEARASGGRVIAIGTTVVRAVEHAVSDGPLTSERHGLADQRLGVESVLRAVDVIVSGTHEPGTSHRELLRAFASDDVLARADRALVDQGFRTHEFGDSVWIEATQRGVRHS